MLRVQRTPRRHPLLPPCSSQPFHRQPLERRLHFCELGQMGPHPVGISLKMHPLARRLRSPHHRKSFNPPGSCVTGAPKYIRPYHLMDDSKKRQLWADMCTPLHSSRSKSNQMLSISSSCAIPQMIRSSTHAMHLSGYIPRNTSAIIDRKPAVVFSIPLGTGSYVVRKITHGKKKKCASPANGTCQNPATNPTSKNTRTPPTRDTIASRPGIGPSPSSTCTFAARL